MLATSGGPDPLLLQAARRLEPLSAALARDTYLDAFAAAMIIGPHALGDGWPELGRSARQASRKWESAGKSYANAYAAFGSDNKKPADKAAGFC